MAQYTEDPSKVGTYNPDQWKFNAYTGQYDENVDYRNAMQYGDPSKGTDVVYPDGGGTEHFAPGETPYTFLSAGDNYAGGVKSAVPGSKTYNDLKDDESTRNWQGIAKIGALVGGAAALGATSWGSTAPGASGAGGAATTYPLAEAGPITATPINAAGAAIGPTVGGGAAAGTGLLNQAAAPAATTAASTVAKTSTTASKFQPVLDFLKGNKDLIGMALAGLGEGMGAAADHQADLDLLQKRDDLTSAHYLGADPAKAYKGLAPGKSGVSPAERFAPSRNYQGLDYEFAFDYESGRIKKVPKTPVPSQAV